MRKTYKLFVGGAFPRSESGTQLFIGSVFPSPSRGDEAQAERRPRVAQGRARRGRRGARGAAEVGGRDRVQPRPGPLPDRRDDGGARARATFARASRPADGPRSSARSTAGSGTRAGPTSSPRCSAPRTPSPGPYFNFTVPEPTGVVAIVAPDAPPLLGLVSRDRARARGRERGRRARDPSRARSPPSSWRRRSRRATSPAAS